MSKRYIYLKPDREETDKTNRYSLYDAGGVDRYSELDASYSVVRKAYEAGQAVRYDLETKRFYRVDMENYHNQSKSSVTSDYDESEFTDVDVKKFINEKASLLKPSLLIFEDFKWKYMVRNVLRGQNTMIIGPTGCGKTQLVKWVAEALDRNLSVFNLGATQDPRGALIGNTHYSEGEGTFFNQSPFIQSIQRPGEIILLDELSRANPEAFNILMTVLDDGQRYIRLDEEPNSPVVKVHPTVTFIATANIGVEYSSTRVIDRALKDRFVPLQMNYLSEADEKKLLQKLFPEMEQKWIDVVAKSVALIRNDVKHSDDSRIDDVLSTRHSIEMMATLEDGFTFDEMLELVVYPNYSDEGGTDSEVTYVKQMLQSVMDDWMRENESQETEAEAEVVEDKSPQFQSIPDF